MTYGVEECLHQLRCGLNLKGTLASGRSLCDKTPSARGRRPSFDPAGKQAAIGRLCRVSGSYLRAFVRRQLFLRIDDNYFSLSTTITFWFLSGAARRRFFFVRDTGIRGGGKVENLLWVLHFSIRPRRRSCGNVGISPAPGGIPKGLVESVGGLVLAFHAFHSPGISTALTRLPI
jgi:hypothetical protein